MITRLIDAWARSPQLSYDQYCDAHGVLDTVAREYYRRLVAPYEDVMCRERGEVFWEEE